MYTFANFSGAALSFGMDKNISSRTLLDCDNLSTPGLMLIHIDIKYPWLIIR